MKLNSPVQLSHRTHKMYCSPELEGALEEDPNALSIVWKCSYCLSNSTELVTHKVCKEKCAQVCLQGTFLSISVSMFIKIIHNLKIKITFETYQDYRVKYLHRFHSSSLFFHNSHWSFLAEPETHEKPQLQVKNGIGLSFSPRTYEYIGYCHSSSYYTLSHILRVVRNYSKDS